MALIAHLRGIKNSNYGQAITYLTEQHNEITDKNGEIVKYEPIYDENGMPKERENFALTYLNSDGKESDPKNWEHDCEATNQKFQKNLNENDIKAHHFVMSFPDEDMKNGLTVEEAHKAAEEYCKTHFEGYQCLIGTQGDTDNIHCHIVVNSVRDKEIEKQDWMTKCADGETIKPSQYEAGGKMVVSAGFREHLREGIAEMEKKHDFTQENWAEKIKEQEKQKQNTRDRLHDKVLEAAQKSGNEREMIDNLHKEGIEYKRRGSQISVREMDSPEKKRGYSNLKQIDLTHKDLTPDLHKFYKPDRQTTKQILHDKVLEAVKNSKNEKELIENLKQAGVDYKRGRGNEISVRETPTEENGRKGKYTRLDSLVLTPHELTPDLYKYYKPERDDKVYEKQKKELEDAIAAEISRRRVKDQFDTIRREEEKKHKRPRQKEIEEYKKEVDTAMKAADFIVIHKGRELNQNRTQGGPTK